MNRIQIFTRKVRTIVLCLALLAASSFMLGVQPVQADSIATVVVTCRIEPAIIPVDGQAMLYVDISQVPQTVVYNSQTINSGMNLYDIEMSFGTSGAMTFLESAPRRGLAPWNNNFAPAGEHVIDNAAGTLKAFGMTNPVNLAFYSNPLNSSVTLFSAPFQLNTPGPLPISITSVDIPIFGIYDVRYSVDLQNCAATSNHTPVVQTPLVDQVASEDAAFTYQFPVDAFVDPDAGDSLTYSASLMGGGALPAWLNFSPATRTFSGTPVNEDVGQLSITVTAEDLALTSVSDTFTLTVENTNDSPTVGTVPDQNVQEGKAYTYTIPAQTFTDVDAGDSLTYSASGLPAWLSFDPDTLTFSGTPTKSDLGNFTVTVTAEDTQGATVNLVIDFTVFTLDKYLFLPLISK